MSLFKNFQIKGGQSLSGPVFTNPNNAFKLQPLRKHIAPGAIHNSSTRRDPPRCHPNTRVDVLTEIMSWLNDPDAEARILWMYGSAGCGKTAVAQTIAEMCTRAGISVASFFFSPVVPGRNTAEKLVPSLAYQLALSIPEIQGSVMRALHHDPLLLSQTISIQAKNLIIEPLNEYFMTLSIDTVSIDTVAIDTVTAIATAPIRPIDNGRTGIIILDGLDECRMEEERNILEMLSEIVIELSFPLFFLVSSRPEQAIRYAFSKEPFQSLASHLVLDDSSSDSDIRNFFLGLFDEIKQTHPARRRLPVTWPSREVIDSLVTQSSGQFIYASTVAKFVNSPLNNPQERLDIVLGQASHPSSGTRGAFGELDNLYHHLFSSIIYIEEVLKIFALLLLHKSMSSQPGIIDEFLCYTPGSTRMFLSNLHSVLFVPPEEEELTGKIRIYHASLSDFLFDQQRSAEFFIDPINGHSKIMRRLFQIILREGSNCSKVLNDACQAALPDLYEIDLPQFVVPLSPPDLNSTRLEDWDLVARFFSWMEDQSHPDHKSNLFHHHLPAIDKWIRDFIDRLRPHSLITKVTTIAFLSLPTVDIERVAYGRSQDIDILLAVAELKPEGINTRPSRTELSFHTYTNDPTPFDVLLRKFMADRSRGAEYILDGGKCAKLARTLWMYVLPYKVRKSLMDKSFGPPYPAPLTFHNFNGIETPSEEELSLLLLPKILSNVSEAETDFLIPFLRMVRDHPLLKYIDPSNPLYRLHEKVSDAAERDLTPALFKKLEEFDKPGDHSSTPRILI